MKWKGRRQSSNVEDRRGQQSAGGMGSGGGLNMGIIVMLLRLLKTKTGLLIAGILIVVSFLFGINPLKIVSQLVGGGLGFTETETYTPTAEEEEFAEFTRTILADTEDVWNSLIQNYQEPTLVMFSGYVSSACGSASSATGPFYCPADRKVYIDLSFFNDMVVQLNAPGEFAQAYVIAHEVGHHIQNLMGISGQVQSQHGKISQKEYNKLSVKLELQADFLAGVWAHHAQKKHKFLEAGDLEDALNAANAIGDDRLQKQATGKVTPDSFTHGTSAQRMRWFKKGFETGDLSQGDTFSAPSL